MTIKESLKKFIFHWLATDQDYCERYGHIPDGPNLGGRRICRRCNQILLVEVKSVETHTPSASDVGVGHVPNDMK